MGLLTRIQLEIEQRILVMMNGSSGSGVSFQSVEKVLRKGSGASRIIRGKPSRVDLFSGRSIHKSFGVYDELLLDRHRDSPEPGSREQRHKPLREAGGDWDCQDSYWHGDRSAKARSQPCGKCSTAVVSTTTSERKSLRLSETHFAYSRAYRVS